LSCAKRVYIESKPIVKPQISVHVVVGQKTNRVRRSRDSSHSPSWNADLASQARGSNEAPSLL